MNGGVSWRPAGPPPRNPSRPGRPGTLFCMGFTKETDRNGEVGWWWCPRAPAPLRKPNRRPGCVRETKTHLIYLRRQSKKQKAKPKTKSKLQPPEGYTQRKFLPQPRTPATDLTRARTHARTKRNDFPVGGQHKVLRPPTLRFLWTLLPKAGVVIATPW